MRKALVVLFFVTNSTGIAQDLSSLYQKVNPSVVTITVKSNVIVGTGARKQTSSVEGIGSGFLISERRIITAAHVVQTAESISVEFTTGEKIPAQVISTYKNADVALIELSFKPKNPVIVTLGNSDEMKIGQRVFVIGAPFGLEHSLSSGYISGKIGNDRRISNAFTELEFFQTDASINHGNSGGPMFNMDGEVIGVVSYILSQSGGFEGLGFAATSNVARDLLLDRNAFYMGIDGTVISGELGKIFNLPQTSAYLVEKAVFLSTGGMMGLKGGIYQANIEGREIMLGGDFILAVEGVEFAPENLDQISGIFNNYKSGDTITLKIFRAGKIMELKGAIN